MKKVGNIAAVVLVMAISLFAEQLSQEVVLPVHAGKDAYTPAVGHGSGTYLVVWQSGRFAAGDMTQGLNPDADLVACRVNTDGTLLDAEPFVVSSAADLQEKPQVAFSGDVFIVVWQDLRNGVDWDIYATRITTTGTVLDPDGILVSGGSRNQALPSVTWDGNNFWIVWSDFRSGKAYEVYGSRVSADGGVLDSAGVMVTSRKIVDKWGFWYHTYSGVTASRGNGAAFHLSLTKSSSPDGYKTPDAIGKFMFNGVCPPDSADSIGIHYKISGHGPDGGRGSPVVLAASPINYLASWRTDYTAGRGSNPTGSTAAIFDSTGQRVVNLHLSSQLRIDRPAVCWDDSLGYIAAWQQNGAASGCPFDVVKAVRVSAAGVANTTVHSICGSLSSPAVGASVATTGSGNALVAYEKHPAVTTEPIQIAFRILSGTTGTFAEMDADKLSEKSFSVSPNPFNPHVNISFSLAAKSLVKLKVFDIQGKQIRSLISREQDKGSHTVAFDGSSLSGGL
jgi:hypothetical protein